MGEERANHVPASRPLKNEAWKRIKNIDRDLNRSLGRAPNHKLSDQSAYGKRHYRGLNGEQKMSIIMFGNIKGLSGF
jgi:hypothetical protein